MVSRPGSAGLTGGLVLAAAAGPGGLPAFANVMPSPPMPFVAEEHHGKLVVMAIMAFAGETGAGERALAPFRGLKAPIVDMLKPMPYPEIYPPDADDYHPLALTRTMFVDTIDLPTAETIVEHLEASDAAMRAA